MPVEITIKITTNAMGHVELRAESEPGPANEGEVLLAEAFKKALHDFMRSRGALDIRPNAGN